ncbi:MAG: hypothetical protein OXN44_11290 [Acidimicrobiaceae bacterium]|nr:hypothetical protein [Acidimicrobiaceae bacterium]
MVAVRRVVVLEPSSWASGSENASIINWSEFVQTGLFRGEFAPCGSEMLTEVLGCRADDNLRITSNLSDRPDTA